MALLLPSSLSSSSASFTPRPGVALPTFPRQTFTRVFPDSPRGPPHLVSRFRVASPSPVPPVRFSLRPGPRLLIVQTQFSSLWLRPRVASGRPEPLPQNLEGERPGGARDGSPDTRDPAAALGPQGARPAADVQLRLAFRDSQAGLREVGGQRHGGELRSRARHTHQPDSASSPTTDRIGARPAGEGGPGSTARVAREGGDVSVAGWDTGRAEVTSGLSAGLWRRRRQQRLRSEWQLRTERTRAAEPRDPRGESLSRAARRPEPGEGPRGARPGSGGGVCRGAAPTASPPPPPSADLSRASPAWRGSVPRHHDDASECTECQQNVGTESL